MKRFTLTILFGMASLFAYAQTGVDPCNASITYSACTSPTSATMLNSWYSGSGASTFPACGINPTTGQYWVRYVAGSTYNFIRIGAQRPSSGGSRIDNPAFEIYTMTSAGSCPSTQPTLSLVSCVNNNTGTTDEYHYMSVTSGTTYYIRFFDADGSIAGGGNFRYCITQYLPGNFACNAISINSLPFTYSGNTSGYTNHAQAPSFSPGGVIIGCSGKDYGFAQGPDVFFSYNSPGSEWIRVNLSGTTPSIYAELSILRAVSSTCSNSALGNLQGASQYSGYLYECYNPPTSTFSGGFMAPGGSSGVDSAICRSIYLDASGTYLFKMDADLSSNTTPFTIDIESHTPANGDACTNAVALSNNVPQGFSNENCNYTWGPDDPDPATLCAGTIENTLWMRFTSDGTGSAISINLSNIVCANADVVATGPPWGWYQYANSWQFGVVTGNCGGPYSPVLCHSDNTSFYSTTFTPTPNTTYYLIMDGNGGSECSWEITVGGITLLASEMLSFTAVPANGNASIRWEASHEENTSHYELQHSKDGETYEVIGSWSAKGAVDESAIYSYVHEEPGSIINYYRIRQVDFNGGWTYSAVKQVRFAKENSVAVEIFPIPASHYLNVVYHAFSAGTRSIKLISVSGITVWGKLADLSSEGNIQIPVSQFSPGIYFLEIQMPDGVERHQILIQ